MVRKRSSSAAAAKVLAVAGIVFGLMLGFFCGHGYVIEAQSTWNTDTLPFAYLGTSLACGAFLFGILGAVKGDGTELGGKSAIAALAAAVVAVVGMLAYVMHVGFAAMSSQALVFWGGVVVVGIVGTLVVAVLGMTSAAKANQLALSSAGLACAAVGGIAIRALMWLCATGYINLFSHTVPSVMLNC